LQKKSITADLPPGTRSMTAKWITGAFTWLLACGTANAQTGSDTPASAPNSIKLSHVIVALPAGTPWLSVRTDILCTLTPVDKTWDGGRAEQDIAPYAASFKSELESAGYKVVTLGEDNLFEEDAGAADYEAAAVITDERINTCHRKYPSMIPLSDILSGGDHSRNEVKGDGSITIDWQLYSRLKRQVVARLTTKGQTKLDHAVPGGAQRLITEAFADNVRALAANPDFQATMRSPRPFTAGFQVPGQQSRIALAGSLKAGPRKIADAVGSVVTVMNDLGSGSGILVSDDGYVLTNAHVVGDDPNARLRWSDGIVTLAKVERVSKNRDVALIKTNPRDRVPLALKRGLVSPGQRVYAIGSPNGEHFQGTVSSGVVSADRVIDGLRYIQSDTTISPGSSGGPLLDESGSVIGITVLHFFNGGQPAGLNMFIPIGDAMDFLSLEQK
jgi:S1-C subfamily serine protease